ncbi:hypothetical protein [Mycobacteroides salmoniphilum]|uniref:hypothetical protein n=1 Tax=Mycobacteroides salmoniphilum TaxID=404941 RepID=UPI0012FF6E7B|nr:hypothetical protein [Mycobacteroides salmoniphilum]
MWGAMLVVVAVVVAGITAIVLLRTRTHARGEPSQQALIGTPKDMLISFPLSRQPVPGWRLSSADIGLPAGVEVGELFAAIGGKAYFVAKQCGPGCSDPRGWVYGVDTATGARLFAPVPLAGFFGTADQCYSNGPSTAVCVNLDCYAPFCKDLQRVWVVDLQNGSLSFSGPTDLHTYGSGLSEQTVVPVGNHLGETRLVAAVKGKGVYGLGPHAEFTWFLPGTGEVTQPWDSEVQDLPPLTLAIQNPDLSNPATIGVTRIFSVDGVDLTPAPPDGTRLVEATVYSGGFAYEMEKGTQRWTAFYDTSGKLIHEEPDNGRLQSNRAMPTLLQGASFNIYTAAGKLASQIPSSSARHFRTIGSKLYAEDPESYSDEKWQQWDLLTNEPGPTCAAHLGGSYVGSDGNIIITRDGTDPRFLAYDPTTCQTLWQTPDYTMLWKVGNGLIQRNNPADSIMSLQQPR